MRKLLKQKLNVKILRSALKDFSRGPENEDKKKCSIGYFSDTFIEQEEKHQPEIFPQLFMQATISRPNEK